MQSPFGFPMAGPVPVAGAAMYGSSGLRGVPGVGDDPRSLNGYVPETFADQVIKFRIPYTMYAEVVLTASTQGQFFPEGSFRHALDKPFEVWRMRTILTATDDAATPVIFEPQPTTLGRRVRLSITDLSKNEPLTSDPTRVDALQTSNFETWEWDVPYTITRAEGFVVQCDTLAFPRVCVNEATDGSACNDISRDVDRVNCGVMFQGFLIILQPASESR